MEKTKTLYVYQQQSDQLDDLPTPPEKPPYHSPRHAQKPMTAKHIEIPSMITAKKPDCIFKADTSFEPNGVTEDRRERKISTTGRAQQIVGALSSSRGNLYSSRSQYKPHSSMDVNQDTIPQSKGMKASALSSTVNTNDELTSSNGKLNTQDGARSFSKTDSVSLYTQPESSIRTSRWGNCSDEPMTEPKQTHSTQHESLDKTTRHQCGFAPEAAKDSNIRILNSEGLEKISLRSRTHHNSPSKGQLIHGSSVHDRLIDQADATSSGRDKTWTEAENKLLFKLMDQLHPWADVLKAFPSRGYLAIIDQLSVIRGDKYLAKKEAEQKRYERFHKEGEIERLRSQTHTKNLKTFVHAEPGEAADNLLQTVKPSTKSSAPPAQYGPEHIQSEHHMVSAENTNHANTGSTEFSKEDNQRTKHTKQIATAAKGEQEYDSGRAAFTQCLLEIQKKDRLHLGLKNVRDDEFGTHKHDSDSEYVTKIIRSRSQDIMDIDTDSELPLAKASPSVQWINGPKFPPVSFSRISSVREDQGHTTSEITESNKVLETASYNPASKVSVALGMHWNSRTSTGPQPIRTSQSPAQVDVQSASQQEVSNRPRNVPSTHRQAHSSYKSAFQELSAVACGADSTLGNLNPSGGDNVKLSRRENFDGRNNTTRYKHTNLSRAPRLAIRYSKRVAQLSKGQTFNDGVTSRRARSRPSALPSASSGVSRLRTLGNGIVQRHPRATEEEVSGYRTVALSLSSRYSVVDSPKVDQREPASGAEATHPIYAFPVHDDHEQVGAFDHSPLLPKNSGSGQVAVANVYGPTAIGASGVPQQVHHSSDPDPYRQSMTAHNQSSASKCEVRLLTKRPTDYFDLGRAEAAKGRESVGREREKGIEEGKESSNNDGVLSSATSTTIIIDFKEEYQRRPEPTSGAVNAARAPPPALHDDPDTIVVAYTPKAPRPPKQAATAKANTSAKLETVICVGPTKRKADILEADTPKTNSQKRKRVSSTTEPESTPQSRSSPAISTTPAQDLTSANLAVHDAYDPESSLGFLKATPNPDGRAPTGSRRGPQRGYFL